MKKSTAEGHKKELRIGGNQDAWGAGKSGFVFFRGGDPGKLRAKINIVGPTTTY